MQLRGQVALITGAGGGIGRVIAQRSAAEGADVSVMDLNRESAQATGEEIKRLGRRAFISTADVGDYDQIQAAICEAAATLGRLDICVSNAGFGKAHAATRPWTQLIGAKFARRPGG